MQGVALLSMYYNQLHRTQSRILQVVELDHHPHTVL